MSIPIQNVPGYVENSFAALQRAKVEYDQLMEKVFNAQDEETREFYARMAAGAMERANVLKSEAEELIREFEAAGGTVKRDPAWGPATDWIFNLPPRR